MTDDDSIDPRDELASAHLDGLTTAEEADRIASDPDLQARVAQLAAARSSLRETDDPGSATADDERRREAGIAAALAAYDEVAAAPAVRDLRPVPTQRRRAVIEARRTWQLVGIAAAVLLLALAVPLLGGLGDSGDDDESSVAMDAATEEGDAERATESASPMAGADDGAGGTEAFDSTTGELLPRLGSFDDLEALTDALAEQRAGATATSSTAPSTTAPSAVADEAVGAAATPCATVGPDADARFLADLGGQEVVVLVFDQTDGHTGVIVVDAIGCAVVGRAGLPPSGD